MKNKITAILLALFLGGFGVQRFYLGQTGKGLLMLFFFWTGVPAIIAIIDIIRWLVMKDEEFNTVYN